MKKNFLRQTVSALVLGGVMLSLSPSAMSAEANIKPDPCTETSKKNEIEASKKALAQRKIIINTLTNEQSFIARETSCVDTMLNFDFTASVSFMSLSNILTTAAKAAIEAAIKNTCEAVYTWVVNEVTGSINKSIGYSGIPGLDNLGSIYVGLGRYGRVGDSGPDYDPITYKKATISNQGQQAPANNKVQSGTQPTAPAPGLLEKIRNFNVF